MMEPRGNSKTSHKGHAKGAGKGAGKGKAKGDDPQRGASVKSIGTQGGTGPDANQNADITDRIVTGFQAPEWLEMLLDVTGLSLLQYKIEAEREERAKDTYSNPYPEVFALVTSLKFEVAIGFIILLNCLTIGIEASTPDGSAEGVFSAIEYVFTALFFVEWCLRVTAFGWVWIFELHNAGDTFLVFVTGVIPKWILEPMSVDISFLQIWTVLRALRLARLARAVRLEPGFKELWMLIHGLTNSARPLLWTWVIAVMILYIFSVAATELIGRQRVFKDNPEVQDLFGDPLRSMFSMFQLMTLDTWSDTLARPVMNEPGYFWLSAFFVLFIFLGVFVFWNLITAIIVENAMKVANEDSSQKAKDMEEQKKQELKSLADLFLEIDKDGSGELSMDEFFGALQNKKVKQMLDLLDLKVSEMKDVWTILDDGDGVLTIKEFSNGLRRMKGEAKAKDIIDVIKKLRHTSLHHTELRAQVEQFGDTLQGLENDINRVAQDTGEVLGLFHEMYHRLQHYIDKCDKEDRANAQERQKVRDAQHVAAAETGEAKNEDGDGDGEDGDGSPL